ncbi:MAG: helix-turn-helix domain-containing protein [Desulfobulbus sp.]|jgi:excisionase family DNA binding protein|uniref:helix-turn-helix domain-containing protein n=1 Tax=Desulfobulbus sp. TaxID=895 RepID=UPI002850D068|nr:helix-turn-helix domain-containing protein [Desulfobulbus sp.]MDR2550005.1 helix-turn-helix domain-containing protein [Desulfobulbus sp.]
MSGWDGVKERITRQDVSEYKREILEQTVLVATPEAASILGCSERTVLRLVRDGEVHAYGRHKGGKGLRLLASELREYVQSIKIDKDAWRV